MDTMPVQFTESLLDLFKPEGTKVCFKSNSLVYDSRNLLSLTAIENDFDRVLWLDSDMQFNPGLLTQLHEDMDQTGADLVTGVYFRRRFPVKPVICRTLDEPLVTDGKITARVDDYYDYPDNALFQVAGCGFGACLTTVSILRDVWNRFGPAFSPLPWAGEDLSFCHRMNTIAPGKMYADSRIKLGHVGTAIFTEEIYRKNRGGGDNGQC